MQPKSATSSCKEQNAESLSLSRYKIHSCCFKTLDRALTDITNHPSHIASDQINPYMVNMMKHELKAQRVASMKLLLCLTLQLLMSVTAFQLGRPLSASPMSQSIHIAPAALKPLCTTSRLHNTASHSNNQPELSTTSRVDTSAIAKYFIALTTQVSLFGLTFYTMDTLLSSILKINASMLPKPLVWFLFYVTSIRSRVFNPLNNTRPKISTSNETSAKGFNDRIMPKWTPPGFIFPIVWLLIISPLRATSSTMIVQSTHSFCTLPLLSFILHLSIGDIWNTINNTERRYGTSVIGVVGVWFSAVHAAYQYSRISPLAGRLLGATCIWLTIAALLIGQTWRLNPSLVNGQERDSFLPMIRTGEESRTKFIWG